MFRKLKNFLVSSLVVGILLFPSSLRAVPVVEEINSTTINTAIQTISNFISGSRGLVTEDNSAAIKAALELVRDYLYKLAEINEWKVTNTCIADTTVTTTKAASETDLWVLTDVSGGGTQNGYLVIEINDVEVWRLYFPANGSVGQKVHLSGSANQKIEGVIVMTAAGNGAVNMRGYKE